MSLLKQIKEIIEPQIEDLGAELIEATLFNKGGRLTLYVAVDIQQTGDRPSHGTVPQNKQDGINLDEIAKVSNRISKVLDETDAIKGRYDLEVSSPGVERPLTKVAHYKKYVCSKVKIKTKESVDGSKNFTGELKSADEEKVILAVDGKKIAISYENIAKANLKVDWPF